MYRFDWQSPLLSDKYGVAHGIDAPFVLTRSHRVAKVDGLAIERRSSTLLCRFGPTCGDFGLSAFIKNITDQCDLIVVSMRNLSNNNIAGSAYRYRVPSGGQWSKIFAPFLMI